MDAVGTNRRAVLLAGIGLGLTGCTLAQTLRYRFTMEVLSDGAVHRASVVQGFRYRPTTPGLEVIDYGEHAAIGEALVIDLADRGLLVATLADWKQLPNGERKIRSAAWWAAQAIEEEEAAEGRPLGVDRAVEFYRGLQPGVPIEFALSELPILVTFSNPLDPKTVRLVDPSNLSEPFGAGARIVRAYVEGADGPLTQRSLEQSLPWVDQAPKDGLYLNGTEYSGSRDLHSILRTIDFRKR